ETKARTLLLQSLPEDHMDEFHHLDDAREIWLAVKARFGGNEESKKMRKTMLKQEFSEFSVSKEEGLHKSYDRFQKILSQLNQMQAKPYNDDVNIKFLRALPPSWSQVALTLKTRGSLEYLSFDDLYSKLRSLEIDVKGGSSYGSRSTTVAPTHFAFIGAASTNTKMVYPDQPSHSSSITYTSAYSGSIMVDVLYSFVDENELTQQLAYEDFEQVDQLEMKELDIKWQMAMLSLRINKFQKKAGRKINFNNKDSARFDRRKARCYNCLQLRHFARECNVKKVDEKARYSAFKISEVKTKEPKAMVSVDSMLNWNEHEAENKTEEGEQVYGLMVGFESDFADHASNAAGSVYNVAAEFAMMGISPKEWEVKYVESLARFDKWKESSKNLAKFKYSSMSTRTKLGLGFKEYIRSDEVCDISTPSVFDPKLENRKVKSLYESDKSSASETYDFASCVSSPKTNDSFSTVDENVKPPRNLCNKSGKADRIHCKNNFVRTKKCFACGSKSHLIKDCNVYDTFPSVISKAAYVPTSSRNSSTSTSAGRSIPAARNKEKLDDFAQIKRGTVTFRGGDGKITGKVLTKEFQLPDESQVVLRIPRRHDLYTFNLSDIQPEQHIHCLLAKASLKESTKWHRRMAHVNFKTINKLAKNGLVEGLPLKLFTNEHNSVACNKEKKHKASYKAITGKANDSFLVGYTANSKAYRVYNLSSKKVEETLNLRYLKDTPNVQGLGQEWYFDLDYLTDSLGYTRFKTNTPTGTQDTTINVSTQDDDSESKCDEHAILVPSFPSNSFSGPKVNDISAPIENNLDYAEELDRLQRQEHEAHFAATKYGFEFSNKTAEMLHQAEIGTHRNLVLAAGDPAGSIVSTGEVPAGSVPAGSVPSGSVTASHVPASSVPARSVPASNVPAGGVLAGSIDYAGFGNPAASESGFAIFTPDHAANSTLPPEEMQQFYNQQVWKPVPLPDGKIAIRTKWILKKKRDSREEDMLKKFDMESVRIATTPYEVPKPKSKDEADDAVNVYLYRSMTGSLMYLIASRPDIMFAMSAYSKHQVTPMTSHLNVVKKIFKYLKGQPNLGLWYPRDSPFQLKAYSDSDYARMIAVSCGFLLYAVQIIGRPPMLLVVPVFLLVVLVHADGWDSAGGCTIPTGSCTIPIALLYKDDHNKVAYLEKGKGWEAYEHILDFLNRSHIQYALTHHLPIVFDCLVKQFWATAIVHTLEAGPSEIIATIDGNEVVVTKSLIRTQLQLNDENRLYEFTIHDVLDGMREIWTLHCCTGHACLGSHTCEGAPLVWEPTPSLVREPTPFREPTPDSPRPLSPPPYPRSEEVGPTSSTRPPSPTRQTSFQEDISEGGGNDVSLPKSNEAPPTAAATAAGGAEDSATLTDLSLKLDRCINRVTTLENELGVTKKVLGEEAATKEQDIDLDALHKLASTSLGGDTTVEAAYTIYKASRTRTKRRRLKKTYTSSDFEHFQENVSVVEDTIPAGDGIPDDAQTTPAGSTPISAGSSMNPSGQVDAAAPSSTIPAADKGKAPMVDDSLPVDLLTEKEREAEFARKQEELAQKAQAKSVASPAEQVPAASSIAANVSVSAVSAHVDTEVHANESRLDDTQTASERVSAEHTIDESTPSSSRNRRKQSAKKRVTPIVDVADDALIKFDSASESDDDPLPYAPYAGWEMVPTLLGFIHAYYDMEEHTKYFTSLRELLHMVEKNDLRKLLGAVDNIYQREEPDTFALILTAGVFAAGIYILVLRYFEPYAEAWVGSPKAARWRRFDHGQTVELASPEQMATGKDVSNPFMAVMVCQKPLGYFSSSKIHVPRAGLVIHPPGEDQMLLFHDPAVFGVPAGCSW
nr:ribonuclease H-like domain-containing protein [Tanacetum cinerariifolium]